MATSYRTLAARFEAARPLHTRRNRIDEELYGLLRESAARRAAAPGEARRLHLLDSAIWEILEDPTRALASCAAAAQDADRRAREKILARALTLIDRVHHRASNHALPDDTPASKKEMLSQAVHDLYGADRSSENAKDLWCAFLAETRKADTLIAYATKDYERDANGRSLRRLLAGLALKFAQTGDWALILSALDRIEADYESAADKAALSASLGILVSAHLRGASEAVRAALAAHPRLRPLSLYGSAAAKLRPAEAGRRKQIWLDVYDGDEAVKCAVVDDLLHQVRHALQPSGGTLWNTVLKATNTKRFWTDEAHRTELVGQIRARVPARGPDSLHLWCEAALLAFEGDMEGAEKIFSRARADETMQKTIERSGAVTFFAAAHGNPAIYDRDDPIFGRTEEIRFTTLPDMQRDMPVMLATADPVFFLRHAESYVETLRRTGSSAPVHFHLAGFTSEVDELAERLQARFGNVSLSVEQPPITKPFYYATMRFVRLPVLLAALERDVLLTDIDVTFHAAPEPMFADAQLRAADAALRVYDAVRVFQRKLSPSLIYRYPRLLPWSHVNAACLAVRHTPGGLRLAEMLSAEATRHLRHVMRLDTPVWLIDQTALFAAFRNARRFAPDIRIANVEDLGMPFGSFSRAQPNDAFPPVGGNARLFPR